MSDADPRDYRSLGDLLRDAREEKQLSLEQLNESTRISVRVLTALEQDDLEGASGLVYVRGFVRTLATFYDLDPEWLGAKLDALAGETSRPVLPVDDEDEVIAGPVADPVPEEPPAETGPKWEVESTRIRRVGASSSPRVSRNLIYGLVAVLVLAITLVWWMGRDSGIEEGRPSKVSSARTELASLDEEPGPGVTQQPSGSPEAGTRADPEPAPSQVREPSTTEAEVITVDTRAGHSQDDQTAIPSGGQNDTVEQDLPAESARTEPASQRMVEVEPPAGSGQTGLSSVLRSAEAGLATTMELLVVADGPVEVTLSSDGARQETRMLRRGEEWRLRGSDHFSLAVSDPAAVRLEIDGRARQLPLNWNGEEWILYPPRADGGERR